MVSKASMALMVFNLCFGMIFPIITMRFLKKKRGTASGCFWVGAATMLLFALVLEQILHFVVQKYTPIAQSWVLSALYGGIAAGLFEETGRFLSMRFLLKKHHSLRANALMYGAGHGGLEMAAILCVGMAGNLFYAVAINAGQTESLLASLDEASRAALESAFATLANTPPAEFLLSTMERVGAFAAQLALSAIVWLGAVERKRGMWILAVGLHAALDIVPAMLAGLGVPTLAIECLVWIFAAALAIWTMRLWKEQYRTYRIVVRGKSGEEPHQDLAPLSVTVRLAERGELEEVNILRKMVNDVHVKGRSDIFRPGFGLELRQYVYQQFDSGKGDVIVAIAGGTICGYAMANVVSRPHTAYSDAQSCYSIEEIGVDAVYRRRGVASAMIDFCRREARRNGLNKLEMEVWSFNQDAMGFIEHQGFSTCRNSMEMNI